MGISSDYLDVDSVASQEVLKPLFGAMCDKDMVVSSCKVDVWFKTYQHGLFGKSESVECSSTSRSFADQVNVTDAVVLLVKTLASINSTTEPEKNRTLVAEVCTCIRKDLKKGDVILSALTLADLGKDAVEIRKKADAMERSQLRALAASIKEKIEQSSDLELFQKARSSFLSLESLVKERDAAFAEFIIGRERFNVSNCYRQAMNKVRYRIATPQLMDMKITVVLAKRSDPKELMTGHYQVSNKQWTWKSASVE